MRLTDEGRPSLEGAPGQSRPRLSRCRVVGTATAGFDRARERYDIVEKSVRRRACSNGICCNDCFHDFRMPDRGNRKIVWAIIFVPKAARQRVNWRDRFDKMSVSRTFRYALIKSPVHSKEQEVVICRRRAPHFHGHFGQERALFSRAAPGCAGGDQSLEFTPHL